MTAIRLKAIVYGSDFRKSDASLYHTFRRSDNFPGELKSGECYLFVSSMENQLIWFLNSIDTETDRGRPMKFTDSRRWRFSASTRWNPGLLTAYAKASGIELVGIKNFTQAFLDNRCTRLEREKEKRDERGKRENGLRKTVRVSRSA